MPLIRQVSIPGERGPSRMLATAFWCLCFSGGWLVGEIEVDDRNTIRTLPTVMNVTAVECTHCKTNRPCDRCQWAIGTVVVRMVADGKWIVVKPRSKAVN